MRNSLSIKDSTLSSVSEATEWALEPIADASLFPTQPLYSTTSSA